MPNAGLNSNSKIFIAGANGMVGRAITRALQAKGYKNLLLPSSKELNLIEQSQVREFFKSQKPEYVFLAAARVGGIYANDALSGDFIYQNLMIEANVIQSAHENATKKLLFLGSSCIYPKEAKQPIPESELLTGPLERTNEAYAIAKIAGVKLCEHYRKQYGSDFISAMPTNLYGSFDHFDPNYSHVIPALIYKFHEAKTKNQPSVTLWGSGKPRREFLHVDDLAEALLVVMDQYSDPRPINIGSGSDVTIQELGALVRDVIGYKGDIVYDTSKPDGTMRKALNVDRVQALGWKHRTPLKEGLQGTYQWYLKNVVKS